MAWWNRKKKADVIEDTSETDVEQQDDEIDDPDLVDDDEGLTDGEVGASIITGKTIDHGSTMQMSSESVVESVERRGQRSTGSSAMNFSKLDEVAAKIAAEQESDDGVLDFSKLSRKERKELKDAMEGTLDAYPYLLALKPHEKYIFHSDYFELDNEVGCVVSFFHNDEATDNFKVFWGIDRIPGNLGEGVTVTVFEQIAAQEEGWIDSKLKTSDKINKLDEREQSDTGTMSTRRRFAKINSDMREIVGELQDGAGYLSVHNRLLIKAPSLRSLDTALDRLKRAYIDRFGTLHAAAHHGEQRQEIENLFKPNKQKRGNGFYYTTTEYAGSHSLVTNGLNDPTGEYVGHMMGDVNTSAVLFDVNNYGHHVVCADETINRSPIVDNSRVVDMWGSKISQAALLGNGRVVHLLLNNTNLDKIGPKFESITSVLNMNSGDVNMFEVFGDVKDELSLFSTHLQKLTLMTEQAYGASDKESLAVIRGKLQEILKEFYVDLNMWAINAKDNRDRLRLVGIPHKEVPLLQVFVTYLDREYTKLNNATDKADKTSLEAVNILRMVFRNLLDAHNDLFNNPTSDAIDSINNARRVVYDFSGLMRRGRGIAMAQLVNVVGFAVESLGQGDTVIIHGSQTITDPSVQDYLAMQFEYLHQRGGRVVYLYDSVDAMLDTQSFNLYHRADYTVLGPMSSDTVNDYQAQMNQLIPPDLARLVSFRGSGASYLRRGATNVVFQTDLALGINPYRKQKSKKKRQQAAGVTDQDGRTSNAREAHRGGGVGFDALSADATVTNAVMEQQQKHRDDRAESQRETENKGADDRDALEKFDAKDELKKFDQGSGRDDRSEAARAKTIAR